jgi:hypothetical protein
MRYGAWIRLLGWWFLLILTASDLTAAGVDYANSSRAGLWLQHPVYGGPSFDAFLHSPQNPLHRGAPPFEWPVNSFFFPDPVSGNWYIYVGDYPEGYATRPSRCVLLRSTDRGRSWSNLGVVLQGNKEMFDQGGHTPDVSVVYAGGRYHMVYDWVEPDWSQLGGLAYAWAEKPEGPFHRAPQPITLNRQLTSLLGRYQRTYAATLVRRKHDWMIVAMMDHAPGSWALFGMTALNPEGPYGERVLLRHVESDGFHPPLLEFYPSFTHRGFLYAPATSVALNRDYNALFRAPLERAAEASAWELVQNGSLWHSDDIENEAYGMWGQTFSGWVDGRGILRVAFQSRDPRGMGTVNVAARPWNQPLRKSGFVMSGHQGPSLTLLRRAYAGFHLEASLRVHGTIRLLFDYDGALGPNLPQSDATLHPLAQSRCQAVELNEHGWRIIHYAQPGEETVVASGPRPSDQTVAVGLERQPSGETRLLLDHQLLWAGNIPSLRHARASSLLGITVQPHSHLVVERFLLRGKPQPAALNYLYTEAILGAGGSQNDWRELHGLECRYGLAAVSKAQGTRVKWNVEGRQLRLWSPRGPDFGTAQVKVDGRVLTNLDLHAARLTPSQPVWTSSHLKNGPHAIVLTATQGLLVVDSLEVVD